MHSHRLQILLDDGRHERITRPARERGVSVATVVRGAIDRGLPGEESRRRAAARNLLEAPDMAVPADPAAGDGRGVPVVISPLHGAASPGHR